MAHKLSCSTAHGIFMGQGPEPVPPALAGRFFTTEPLGKSFLMVFKISQLVIVLVSLFL